MNEEKFQIIKASMDGTSIGITVAVVLEMLPHLSALLAIIWMLIRIYETATVQKLVDKYTKRKVK